MYLFLSLYISAIILNTSGVVSTLEHLLSKCIVLLYARFSLLKYRYLVQDSGVTITCLEHCSATELTNVVNCGPRKLSKLLKKSINKLVFSGKKYKYFNFHVDKNITKF